MGIENDAAIEIERERRLTIFRPVFQLLVSLVSFRVTYPQNYDQLSMEDLTDFKRTRFVVGDMLTDTASVLGEEVTKIGTGSMASNFNLLQKASCY